VLFGHIGRMSNCSFYKFINAVKPVFIGTFTQLNLVLSGKLSQSRGTLI